MYNSLIDNLKKILEGKDTADKKLLKIQTLVDFAAGLEQPRWTPQPTMPIDVNRPMAQPLQQGKPAAGTGAIIGVEDIK